VKCPQALIAALKALRHPKPASINRYNLTNHTFIYICRMADTAKRRVMITGMGVVSPNGVGNSAFSDAILAGKSGVKRISRFDPDEIPVRIAGEVRDFDELAWVEKRDRKHVSRVLPLAIANGAGSGSENAVGRGVIGGMLSATFLAPFLIPMFFLVITEKVFKPRRAAPPALPGTAAPEPVTGAAT